MANQKKKSTAKKGSSKQNSSPSEGKRQIVAVLLFAAAVFCMCIVIIPGQNVWNALHKFAFGIFGFVAYLVPILIGWVAFMFALDKTDSSAVAKFTEIAVLVILIGATIDVFMTPDVKPAVNYFEHILNAYKDAAGGSLNGGFIGSLLGYGLFLLFGKVAASITLIILLFVFLMLCTGTTLIGFFRTISKPVKHIESQAQEAYENKVLVEKEQKPEPKKKKRNAFDVPMDDEKPEKDDKLSEKGQALVDICNPETVVPADIVEEPADTLDETQSEPQEGEALEEYEDIVSSSEQQKDAQENTYSYPPLSLLNDNKNGNNSISQNDLNETATLLVDTLKSFGVETRIVDISRGPVVTRYELQPSAGVKINRITNLVDDITLNLATAGVRIEAPIPNKAAVGIEVPNKKPNMVTVKEILESSDFVDSKSKLTAALGRDIGGNAVVCNIADMPHGLIAGATNSGKSVCINSIIISILYKATPDEVKLILIDPKVVELGTYNGIPHLLIPVVTDPRKASGALSWAVMEMEKRYKMFAEHNVRDIKGYNELAEMSDDMQKMAQIVIIIDELADLMMTAAKEVEESVCRIAQKARAAGMHLIIATQRPSVDVVTGLIKANIPTRVAFAVSSHIDSRTILDVGGAEKLLGKGDMLYSPLGASKPSRVQGCFVSSKEISAVVDYVKSNHEINYDESVMEEIERQAEEKKSGAKGGGFEESDETGVDPMLDQAIEVVVEAGQASTSLLQRRLRLGYARAARIIDQMQERGIVGEYQGSKPREVLITKAQLLEKHASED